MATAHFYARVSTAEQEDSLVAQTNQMRAYYEAFLKARGFAEGRLYIDKGVSGGIPFFRRPASRACHEALKSGDAVVIAKLDRGFRNCQDALLCLETWEKGGVGLHLLDIRVDTSTAVGKLMLSIFAAFAEWERKRIGERTREARIAGDEKRARKLMPGATLAPVPPRCWKWKKLAGGWKDIVPVFPDILHIKRATRLRASGMSYERIWSVFWQEGVRRLKGNLWNMFSLPSAIKELPAIMAAKGVAWAKPDDDNDGTFVPLEAGRGEQSDLPGDGTGVGTQGDGAAGMGHGAEGGNGTSDPAQVRSPDHRDGGPEVPVEEGGAAVRGTKSPGNQG